MDHKEQPQITIEELNQFRRRFLDAKRQLAAAEALFFASYGRKHPGSPLVTNTSLADIAIEFIRDKGYGLTYKELRAMFTLNYIEFDEGKLKKALRHAIRGPALQRTHCADPDKVSDDDVFDLGNEKGPGAVPIPPSSDL